MPPWSIEPLLQKWRINKIMPYFPFGGIHLDIGCDVPPVLINQVKHKMKKCIGLDVVVKPQSYENVEIIPMDIQKKIKLPDQSTDVITMLAVLEHMQYPEEITSECFRLLNPGGVLLITVPSPANEKVLNVFAKLRLVRPEMIDQHENYFTPEILKKILTRAGFKKVVVEMFEFGLNTFVRAYA